MISIVLPVHNLKAAAWEYTRRAVESIRRFTEIPHEIILVDNNSTRQDLTASLCCPKTLLLDRNIGFGQACNLGFAIANDDYPFIAQMNTDCELVEDTFSILINAMKEHDLDVAFPEHYENCKHYGMGKSEVLMGDKWRFGACWVARREALEERRQLEGFIFDPRFFAYYEDTDLWKRLQLAGKKLHGWRGTWVKHKGGVSGSAETTPKIFNESKRLFEEKWGIK